MSLRLPARPGSTSISRNVRGAVFDAVLPLFNEGTDDDLRLDLLRRRPGWSQRDRAIGAKHCLTLTRL
jgi:hypothetical protein